MTIHPIIYPCAFLFNTLSQWRILFYVARPPRAPCRTIIICIACLYYNLILHTAVLAPLLNTYPRSTATDTQVGEPPENTIISDLKFRFVNPTPAIVYTKLIPMEVTEAKKDPRACRTVWEGEGEGRKREYWRNKGKSSIMRIVILLLLVHLDAQICGSLSRSLSLALSHPL